ncbi:MAG: DUF2029 domain-containing protein [Polyangiaceae bacterium]|nr:DUF2029 domain-containing protein [Polyangiaceae bacterium]
MHTAFRALERHLLVACFALILAPVAAHGLWRPLLVALGGDATGMAPRVTIASLGISAYSLVAMRALHHKGAGIRAAAACLPAIFAAVALGGGPALALALLAAVGTTLFIAAACITRMPAELDGLLTSHRGWMAAWIILAIAVVVKSALLSTFIGDPAHPQYSLFPKEPFLVHHSCLSGYVYAAERFLDGEANIFDASHMPPREVVWNPRFAPFHVDRFPNPPTFLLVALGLVKTVSGFYAQRALWYGLCGMVIAATLWLVAQWVGGRRGAIALLLAPWVWLSWGYALQLGNSHALVMAASMAGMLAFEKRRHVLGGGLLAAATLFKMSPGLLGVVLLVQRRWRDAALTFAAGILLVLLGLVVIGPKTHEAWFTYLVPRLASGEYMSDLARDARTITSNYGPFGIPFKLQLMGMDLDPWKVGRQIAKVYVVLVVGFAIFAARRRDGRGNQATMWLAVLSFASLQTPFPPPYYLSTVYWIISLVAGEIRSRGGAFVLTAVTFATLAPAIPAPQAALAALSIAAQFVVLGILLWSILRKSEPVDPPQESPAEEPAIQA